MVETKSLFLFIEKEENSNNIRRNLRRRPCTKTITDRSFNRIILQLYLLLGALFNQIFFFFSVYNKIFLLSMYIIFCFSPRFHRINKRMEYRTKSCRRFTINFFSIHHILHWFIFSRLWNNTLFGTRTKTNLSTRIHCSRYKTFYKTFLTPEQRPI